MAFQGPIDAPRLFVLGVGVVPLVGSYATAVVARGLAARREFVIGASKYEISGVVFGLYVMAASSTGVLLGATGGVPSGVGLGRTIAFSVTVSAVPTALGALLFGRYLLSALDTYETELSADSSVAAAVGPDGVLPVLVGSTASFLAAFALSLPSFFVFGLLIG